jgi:predicted transcriptional regulator
MSKSAVVTARLDPETLALVDRISAAHGRSRSWFAAEAIRKAAEDEARFLAFVQEGIDAADRGDVVPHAAAVAQIDAMIAKHEARCAK